MNNEIEFKFGDYAIIEQKRHGVPNEMFVHKVIDQLRSNTWVDVPVQSPATETLHDEMEDVCWCICCGVDETEVRAYRVKDMQRSSRSPDGGEVTALVLTLEGNKVQTIIHGVTLSALRELQERRKADSEPVAWTDEEELRDANESGSGYLFGIERDANKFADPRRQIMLYRHAQPAPVVPDEKPMPNPLSMYAGDAVAAIAEVKGWNACRAAMLNGGES